ncbi:MAG: EAL domain-containing protein [Acidobacteriota bacterium]
MEEISPQRIDLNRPFMYTVVTIGAAACLLALLNFPVREVDLPLIVLALATVFLSSRVGIEFSRHKVQITVSDTFIFLILLLYGGEAAVLVAAAEAFWSSFRFSRLWLTRAFNGALLGTSTFIASAVVTLIFGSTVELTRSGRATEFAMAIGILAATQYLANSSIAAVRLALKTRQPLWTTWKEHFLWTSVTYFAGGSAAGVTAKLITGNGFYAFIAALPIISIIYFTYETYRKQLEAKTEQADQAILHAKEQERISHELRESEEHLRGAFDYAAVGMALLGTNGRWLRVNQSFCGLLGYSESELLQTDLQSITHPEDLGGELADMYRLLEGKVVTVTTEKRFLHKDGREIWTIISMSTVSDSDGRPMHFVFQAQDITERRQGEAKLERAAFYDSLTSLPNRARFTERLQSTIDRASGNADDEQYAVLFLDIDRFKNVNDSLGHAMGDQLLISVGRRLEMCVRPNDIVSRFGGDEFAVLLKGLKSENAAVTIAERIRRELALPFDLAGHEVFSGGSIGMALSTCGYKESEEIIRDADTAMYRAKEQGNGRFEIFDREMHARVISRLQLENDLRKAIERKEFEVYYQPIIELAANTISGFEALVRWNHPERGFISPADFIDVAEETDLIVPLGQIVLTEACRQLSEFQRMTGKRKPLTMSVNLSGRQFKQFDLVEQVKQALHQSKLDPACLTLEITESILMDSADSAIVMLRQLRAIGVQLSIDDFGTGYSSLSYLHRFPVNILKVDRSFVNRMADDEESLAIVETVITLAAKLKMKVVAEGVETEIQRGLLHHMNCEYVQGFLFSKPVPAELASMLISTESFAPTASPSDPPPASPVNAPDGSYLM